MNPKHVTPLVVKERPRCPACNRTIDGFSSRDDALPKAGDYNVCTRCLAVGVFTGNGLEMRLAKPEEIQAQIDKGELTGDDAKFLLMCVAASAARRGSAKA